MGVAGAWESSAEAAGAWESSEEAAGASVEDRLWVVPSMAMEAGGAGWVVSMVPGFVAGDVDCFASFSCVETGFQAGNALRVHLSHYGGFLLFVMLVPECLIPVLNHALVLVLLYPMHGVAVEMS